MQTGPTGSVILDLYEQGMTAGPAVRTALLARAGGGVDDPTLGDADRAAWAFLNCHFKGQHQAVLTCESCGKDVEFTLPPDFTLPDGAETFEVEHNGQTITLRQPRLTDIRAGRLRPERLAPSVDWSDPTFRAVAEAALIKADPALKTEFALTCAACGADQSQVFDVAGFVWLRLEMAARALVRDVARLARHYGWSEAEITAMSPARRAIYLREIAE